MDRRTRWVLLAYRLPREPSTPRIGLWRSLRRLGVGQIADGVVALPLDARTRERFDWLAQEVIENGGEATVWLAEPGSAAQERALASEMAADGRGRLPARHRRGARGGSANPRPLAGGRWPASAASCGGSARATTSPAPIAEQARSAVDALGDSLEAVS